MTTPAEIKSWFTARIGRRITATDIADALNVSRNTANSRLSEGLDAGDTITVATHFGVNPVEALVELGHISYDDAFTFVDSDGTLLTTATQEQLIRQLAEDSLPLSDRIEIGAAARALADRRDDFEARRASRLQSNDRGHLSPVDDHDGTVRPFDWAPGTYAADSSPDEQAEREAEGSDPID
ncbi:hypothetical protein [Corynebacterium glyciniphilum]|uniref:hypothetical protein n=1 Tax=Corynebacterium glyciniphilum TaxID=1404244 RepID=UPI00264DF567|nr:hypothetical protein [Corynebacterium glyciniphilum]MDN6706415.1 hypothetical protein [Corynebacterium glyciniphilum]